MEQAIFLMNAWQDKIPADQAYLIQRQLEDVDEKQLYSLSSIQLKSPIVGLILGFFLGVFGIDRFYKGDIGLGIVKLCLCWLTFGVWWAIDLYLVWKGIKQDNLRKISQALSFARKK